MKHFIGFEAKATKQVYGGYKKTLKIYTNIKNNLQYIGKLTYYTGSTRGADSEVYNFLIENKYIPKKAYKYSESPWSGGGYYLRSNPYCKIQIIEQI